MTRRRPTPRHLIIAATTGSLVTAFGLTALWFADSSGGGRLEPAAEALGLLAGISGIVAERRAATRERREQALAAVRDELLANRAVLGAPPFGVPEDLTEDLPGPRGQRPRPPRLTRQVYRRLVVPAVDAALLSAVLHPGKDAVLARRLRDWRNQVEVFNQQLTLAEILAFTSPTDQLDAVLADLHDGLHGADGPLVAMRRRIDELLRDLGPEDHRG